MVEEGKVGGGGRSSSSAGSRQPASLGPEARSHSSMQIDGHTIRTTVSSSWGTRGPEEKRYKGGSSKAGYQGVREGRARRPGTRKVARSPAEVSSRERLQPGALRHVLHRLSDAEVGEDVLGAALCKMQGRASVSSGVADAHRPSEGRRTSTASKACVLEETEAGRA
jgi:hypothetical protein